MTTTMDAIYEKGVLRPVRPIPVADGTKVQITVTTPETAEKAVLAPGRFRWERLQARQDTYAGSATDELIRQRREE